MQSYKKLVVSLILPFTAAFIGSLFTMPAIPTWYALLQKPSFNPPNWLFGPVWTLLYLLMAIALYLVWKTPVKKGNERLLQSAFIIFGFQLLCNLLWSIVFFGMQNPGLGLVVILVLWCAIVSTIWKFYAINKIAGYLLLPYIFWVSFASILNYYIIILN